MITWFLVGCVVWNLIGLIAALGSIIFWAFMWLLWKLTPAASFDHLCNGPPKAPPPPHPSQWIPPSQRSDASYSVLQPIPLNELPRSSAEDSPPGINGQTKIPGWAAASVIVGILALIAVPVMVLVARAK